MCEISEGVLGNIRVKNLSQRDCKYKINDQMGKHVNQNVNLFFFFSPLKDMGDFSSAMSNTGQRTCKSRCNERCPTVLVTAEGGSDCPLWEASSADSS